MTDQATRVVPAGWYQDPAIAEQVRWWNGLSWTEHVREKPTLAITAAAAETGNESAADRVAASRALERQFGIGTSENEIIAGATALGYGTGSAMAARAAITTGSTTSSNSTGTLNPANPAVQRAAAARLENSQSASRATTGPGWLIALTPALAAVTVIAAVYVFFYIDRVPVVFAAAFLVPYLLGIFWALGDRHTLRSRGFNPPNAAWAALTPIAYLIARRTRVPGNGPLIMFLILGLLVTGLPPLASATGQLRPLENALTIQNTLKTTYVDSGRVVSVSCPPFVDAVTPGTLYTCDATLATGVVKSIWVSIDGPNGMFTYAMSL